MDQLLEAGLNPNTIDSDVKRQSLLHWASAYADAETVRILLIRGANSNVTDTEGVAPLHEALHRKSEEIAEILTESGADLHLKATAG